MAYAPKLSWAVSEQYAKLPQNGMYQAEYVWIGGGGLDFRCKTRTLTKEPTDIKDFPVWNFDGMSYSSPPFHCFSPISPHDIDNIEINKSESTYM